jgi:hypothetical protein
VRERGTVAYLRISEARTAGRAACVPLQKSAGQLLTEDARRFSSEKQYDIFLSHSYDDGELILGVKKLIEALGLTVYVDWIDDAKLDRSRVTVKTAALLRARMRSCSSLVYAHSSNSSDSVWMPWELGYFDGFKPSQVWVLPLVADSDSEFKNQEYLGLYPTVEKLATLSGKQNLGFDNVGDDRHQVPLAKAARGHGVFYTG